MSQQINLANPLLTKKRHAFGLREMALGIGIAGLAALAWGLVVLERARTLEAQADQIEARLAAAQQARDARRTAAARPASALLRERIEATRAQVAQREALLAMIGDTPDAAPTGFSPRLRALSASHVEGVWLNAFEFAPDVVVLRGAALQAGLLTAYLDKLGQQAAFAGLRFARVAAAPASTPPAPEGGAAGGAPVGPVDFELAAGRLDGETDHGR